MKLIFNYLTSISKFNLIIPFQIGGEHGGDGGREHQVPENRRFRRRSGVSRHLVQGANTRLLEVVVHKNVQSLPLNFMLRKVYALSVVYQC